MFTGQIKTWDDKAIAGLNPGAKLPSDPIAFAVRQDSSGTSDVFTTYLATISPDFKTKLGGSGHSSQPDWSKVGIPVTAANQNDGVAQLDQKHRRHSRLC